MPLSEMLVTSIDGVLARYLRVMRASVTAEEMSDRDVLDSLRRYLGELSAELIQGGAQGNSRAAAVLHANATALEHGAQRISVGFDVVAVARDYHLLHGCILEVAEEKGVVPSLAEHRALVRYMGAAAARAVEQYQRVRDREQERQAAEQLGFMAHELRNPLSSARMAFDLLLQTELSTGGKAVDILDRGLKSTIKLIDDALTQTRLRTFDVQRLESVNLAEVLADVRQECELETAAKHIRLELVVASQLLVKADRRLIHSVVSNLTRNALKFSHDNGRVILRAREDDGAAVVEVEDSCGGLSPETVSRVFETHVQVGRDRSGFGLGLAIAKLAAEAHQGRLEVQNLEGKGCVFRLTIPLHPPSETKSISDQ